ncbi:MAG TPA: TIGR02391 family protein [Candidatus Babeliales bacterium]|nr:TIGR02391 family protein [Candidatus Babeliales bacterium]
MARRSASVERHPAKLSYEEMKAAITKIDRRLDEIKAVDIQTIRQGNEPILQVLSGKLQQLLIDTFGNSTHEYFQYASCTELRVVSLQMGGTPISQIQDWAQAKLSAAIAMLETIKATFTEALHDAGISGTTVKAIKAYEGLELHPIIAQATSSLFRTSHYANAIEDGVKALNDLVRKKTGLELDGVPLMQKAFSKNNPILRFNPLVDDSDRNEQQGFMEWFTGTVTGLRNPRAHKIIKDDPEMALEFIAFISLLAKLVDKTTK